MIPFPAFAPSRSLYNPAVATVIVNALPKADGWGPMPQLSVYSNPLPAECRGAIYVRDSDGNISIFAGTASKLYRYNSGTRNWDDITRVDGAGAAVDYTLPSGDNWCFARFGQYLVATQLGDAPQVFDIDAGTTFEDLAGSPPRAKYCWTAGGFLVLGHLVGFPGRIHWSGLEDIGHWTLGENGADLQDLPDGEEVQGGISDTSGAFIIQRRAIRYMRFIGGQYVFAIEVLNSARGAVSPLSLVQIGPQQFAYLSEDGFFMGAAGRPLGAETIDEWFLKKEVALDDLSIVQGTADPFEKIVWWQYANTSGQKRMIGYNWQLGRWTYSDVEVGFLMSALTAGVTWDGLDALYATLDEITEPFDSRAFKGGRPVFSGFDTQNRLSTFSGAPMAATMETATVAHGGVDRRSFVNGCRLITDASSDGYTLAVGTADKHGDAIGWKAAARANATGLVPARANGRLHRYRLELEAGAVWSHVHGLEPQVKAGGRR